MKWTDLIRPPVVIPTGKIRQEIYRLGGRHQGEALAGALAELAEGGLTADRRALLHAVVSYLGQPIPGDAVQGSGSGAAATDAAGWGYMAIIAAAAAWTAVVMHGMGG
jgi:hypothetical protein